MCIRDSHRPDVMIKAFEMAGYTAQDVEEKFGALFNAFHYGAPPHAGMAPGVDRLIMLLRDEDNIREVIAFPMNSNADVYKRQRRGGEPVAVYRLHLKSPGGKGTFGGHL